MSDSVTPRIVAKKLQQADLSGTRTVPIADGKVTLDPSGALIVGINTLDSRFALAIDLTSLSTTVSDQGAAITALQTGKADKGTTLADYGITDALSLSGGTLTGPLVGTSASFSGKVTTPAGTSNSDLGLAIGTGGEGFFVVGGYIYAARTGGYGRLRVEQIDSQANHWGLRTAGLELASGKGVIFSSTTGYSSTPDLGIHRNAAGVVEINNGTPGTLRDLTCRNATLGGTVKVGGSGLGATLDGSIASTLTLKGPSGTGTSNLVCGQITAANLLASVDATYDIGQSAGFRYRHIYAAGNVVAGTGTYRTTIGGANANSLYIGTAGSPNLGRLYVDTGGGLTVIDYPGSTAGVAGMSGGSISGSGNAQIYAYGSTSAAPYAGAVRMLTGNTDRLVIDNTGAIVLSPTWNGAGTTFTALTVNATDTASAAASLLQDWQVGGVSKASVSKGGSAIFNVDGSIGHAMQLKGAGGLLRLYRAGVSDFSLGDASGIFAIKNNGTNALMQTIDPNSKAVGFYGPLSLGPYTFATLPAASSNAGALVRITDRGQKHAYSDGTNWLFVHDNSVVV